VCQRAVGYERSRSGAGRLSCLSMRVRYLFFVQQNDQCESGGQSLSDEDSPEQSAGKVAWTPTARALRTLDIQCHFMANKRVHYTFQYSILLLQTVVVI